MSNQSPQFFVIMQRACMSSEFTSRLFENHNSLTKEKSVDNKIYYMTLAPQSPCSVHIAQRISQLLYHRVVVPCIGLPRLSWQHTCVKIAFCLFSSTERYKSTDCTGCSVMEKGDSAVVIFDVRKLGYNLKQRQGIRGAPQIIPKKNLGLCTDQKYFYRSNMAFIVVPDNLAQSSCGGVEEDMVDVSDTLPCCPFSHQISRQPSLSNTVSWCSCLN